MPTVTKSTFCLVAIAFKATVVLCMNLVEERYNFGCPRTILFYYVLKQSKLSNAEVNRRQNVQAECFGENCRLNFLPPFDFHVVMIGAFFECCELLRKYFSSCTTHEWFSFSFCSAIRFAAR